MELLELLYKGKDVYLSGLSNMQIGFVGQWDDLADLIALSTISDVRRVDYGGYTFIKGHAFREGSGSGYLNVKLTHNVHEGGLLEKLVAYGWFDPRGLVRIQGNECRVLIGTTTSAVLFRGRELPCSHKGYILCTDNPELLPHQHEWVLAQIKTLCNEPLPPDALAAVHNLIHSSSRYFVGKDWSGGRRATSYASAPIFFDVNKIKVGRRLGQLYVKERLIPDLLVNIETADSSRIKQGILKWIPGKLLKISGIVEWYESGVLIAGENRIRSATCFAVNTGDRLLICGSMFTESWLVDALGGEWLRFANDCADL